MKAGPRWIHETDCLGLLEQAEELRRPGIIRKEKNKS